MVDFGILAKIDRRIFKVRFQKILLWRSSWRQLTVMDSTFVNSMMLKLVEYGHLKPQKIGPQTSYLPSTPIISMKFRTFETSFEKSTVEFSKFVFRSSFQNSTVDFGILARIDDRFLNICIETYDIEFPKFDRRFWPKCQNRRSNFEKNLWKRTSCW